MKKTFLAMILAGSSMAMFAQTTPPTNPKTPVNPTSPTTTPAYPTTSPTTTPANPATSPTTTSPLYNSSTTNGNVTNSTTDPMKTPTNAAVNNGMNNNGSWNTGTPTNLGWNNYGIWNNNNAVNGINSTGGNNMNNGTTNSYTTANGNQNNANNTTYGTPNAMIPYSVQMDYGKSYPMAASSGNTWTQYGDWFYTTYMGKNRYSQIFYDNRGNGYSVALPVLNTYVPEDVVAMALQKYGSNLYSITMLKSASGDNTYQINLLDRGQPKMEWLDSVGGTALNIYRTEEMNGTMNTNSTNAAMDNSSSTNNSSGTVTGNGSTMNDHADKDTNGYDNNSTGKKMKSKVKNEDGTVTKPGKVKVKTKSGSNLK